MSFCHSRAGENDAVFFQRATRLRNSPEITSGFDSGQKSHPETSVRFFLLSTNSSLMRFEVASLAAAFARAGKRLGFIIARSVSEGFTEILRKTQKHNPSLTRRVGIVTNAQLQKANAGVSKTWYCNSFCGTTVVLVSPRRGGSR